ncbi:MULTISPECIES: acyl carrier protein [Paenibacillus]|uniref:acyl carrier protein n=1 Tax=Paenibacillus TaxID=44249 RepID=UPI0022B8EA3A|nr:acyl carrier protein [Paenibacillus caseinilyticus]MCZ8522700.1 acyl carrier protein [Paenibacillus caseinilyticus]
MDKEQIFRIVIEHTRELLPELEDHVFQYSDRLSDLGANSVDRAEIVMMTMETLSLSIPRVELFGASNIGELVDIIHAKLQLV